MSRRVISALSGMAILAGLAVTAPSWADAPPPPPNDNRADATVVNPPQSSIKGTLVGATLEPANDLDSCGNTDGSVWYRFKAPATGIIIQFSAAGEMDATVNLFRQVRSRLDYVDCKATPESGSMTLDDDGLVAGSTYLIRVGKVFGSVADTFSMNVLVPSPPPKPPGKPLPAKGVKGSVDRLLNTGDAYSAFLRQGVTTKVSLRVNQCTKLEIYAPGVKDFDGFPLVDRRCGGFSLFTPDESGKYVFVVWAGRGQGPQKYRLQVAKAGKDDTGPGIFIGNNARVRGRVNGGIDSRDLYRFDVSRRSQLQLSVSGGPELRLFSDSGRRWGRSESYDMTVKPGRFYVAVEGQGKYTLRRISKTVTKASVQFNGKRSATVAPGSNPRMTLRVSPAVSGPGVMLLERRDPVDGWQFVRRYRVQVSNGSATVSFSPQIGHYRLTGDFNGTQTAASSTTGTAKLRVQAPLTE